MFTSNDNANPRLQTGHNESISTKLHSESIDSSILNSHELSILNLDPNALAFASPKLLKSTLYSYFFYIAEGNDSTKLQKFIDEITMDYSVLLVLSIEVAKILVEMRLVKNYLYDYCKSLQNEKRELAKEYNETLKRNNSILNINEKLIEHRESIRQQLIDCQKELSTAKITEENVKIQHEILKKRLKKTEEDYLEYREIYSKELNNLKYDLKKVIKERDETVMKLEKIRKYFEEIVVSKVF